MQKIQSLDVARGLAVVLGVLFHASIIFTSKFESFPFKGTFDIGHIRVDFFFVLSGFIIHYIYAKYIGQKDKFASYCFKRLTRIYPAYWVALLLMVLGFILFPSTGKGYINYPGLVLKSLLLIPSAKIMLAPAWTLSYEMLFYAVFAVLIFNRQAGILLLIAWLLTMVFANRYNGEPFAIHFLGDWYHLEFFFGMLASILVKAELRRQTLSKHSPVLLLVGCCLLAINYHFSKNVFDSSFSLRAVYGLSIGLIVLGLVLHERSNSISYPKSLKLLGASSYAIFIIHWPILLACAGVTKRLMLRSYLSDFILFSLSVCLAILSGVMFHLTIEKRFSILFQAKHPRLETSQRGV